MMSRKIIAVLLLVWGGCTPLFATHATFQPGYGTRALGMGGVATAYPQDTVISSVNPAGMVWLGNRLDVGFALFYPNREYHFPEANNRNIKSGDDFFPIPHFGFSWSPFCGHALGLSIYANGGLSTKYPESSFDDQIFDLGINLAEFIFAPTYAFILFQNTKYCQSFGVVPLVKLMRLETFGLCNFVPFSAFPNDLSDNQFDWVWGVGGRLGWMGRVCQLPRSLGILWAGAAYSTKIYTQRLMKYRGLLADQARLHTPANYSFGFRLETNKINLAFDYQKILYGDIPAAANPIDSLFQGVQLGAPKGAGFGWHDVTVFKYGADYSPFPWIILRGGYSYGNVPFNNSQMDAAVIAPVVTKHHVMCGLTLFIRGNQEFDFAYLHAFSHKVEGPSRFRPLMLQIRMYQNLFEFNWAWKF